MKPIFLDPVFKERIWGGTALKDRFGYDIPSDKTGECWAISAHPNGASIVRDGPYAGKTLDKLWTEHRDLFGNSKGNVFPLLTKILDANDDLSVQVHPDDSYANVHENGELGKTECWYIIDCKDDAEMIYGHNAETREELVQMIENAQWNDLLNRVKIKPGDFFFVPSGTIHALCKGTLVLETQQSSDTTYRVYDYNRRDDNGNTRELHLEKAIAVTTVPHLDGVIHPTIEKKENVTITTFVQDKYFSVYKWVLEGEATFSMNEPFLIGSVTQGTGMLIHNGKEYELKNGSHFLLPAKIKQFDVKGNCELIISHL